MLTTCMIFFRSWNIICDYVQCLKSLRKLYSSFGNCMEKWVVSPYLSISMYKDNFFIFFLINVKEWWRNSKTLNTVGSYLFMRYCFAYWSVESIAEAVPVQTVGVTSALQWRSLIHMLYDGKRIRVTIDSLIFSAIYR